MKPQAYRKEFERVMAQRQTAELAQVARPRSAPAEPGLISVDEVLRGRGRGRPQTTFEHLPDLCPRCGVSLVGDPIPPESRHLHGGKRFGSRRVAIYDRELDRTIAWECPDCGHQWKR